MSQFRIVHDGECHSLRGWSEMLGCPYSTAQLAVEHITRTAVTKSCYRARLTEELNKRSDLWYLPVSWSHFRGNKLVCPLDVQDG